VDKPLYKAFISYSHSDERWAKWLQRSLERYRVPRRLVGKQGDHGTIPRRLRPVFRDREDLSSASDLSGRIKQELDRSEFLVVICSPEAAASRWAGEEIRYFREQGRDDRILSIVVAGDTHADAGADCCFPDALLVAPDGSRREPLAADVRRYADGKHLALLKIIAGLLGVRLDELRRRDAQRRLQRRLSWGSATVVLVLVLGWLLYSQAASREAAKVQRANTEDLLSYMLGDLERLDPIAGVESVTVEHSEYDPRARTLGLRSLDADSLLEKAMAWREAAGDLNWEGKLQPALEQSMDSHAALIELHRREGNTDRILFELGQAEFYVGEIQVQMGDLDSAREHWIHYGALTRKLLNRQPDNPRYVMELSYTLMNLGALEHRFPSPDIEKSLELLQAALQYNQIALVLDPDNLEYRDSLSGELAWLADTWLMKCSLGNALTTRQETVDLTRELAKDNPGDSYYEQNLAFSLTGLAGVQRQIGLDEEAIGSFEEAVDIFRAMHESEPANEDIEWNMLIRNSMLADLLAWQNELDRSALIMESVTGRIRDLAGEEANVHVQRRIDTGLIDLTHARILLARGDAAEAERRLESSLSQLAGLVAERPDEGKALEALGWAVFDYWEQFGRLPPEVEGLLPEDFLPGPDEVEFCSAADQAARLAVIEGDLLSARQYVDHALSRGYFDASFTAFCKRYDLCELP
jgi:tetratricopeptide (TPR) repeat protein